MNQISLISTHVLNQARAQTFWGAGAQKKKDLAKVITELLAAVPCPSAFLLFFWHYAAITLIMLFSTCVSSWQD